MNKTTHAFVIDQQLQGLLSNAEREFTEAQLDIPNGKNVLSMQAVVNAVMAPQLAHSKQTLEKVNSSIKYVNWYMFILANYTNMHCAVQVAASSPNANQLMVTRKGTGFTLNASQTSDSKVNVYIDVVHEKVTNIQKDIGLFIHCLCKQQLYVIPMGVPVNNKAHTIIDAQDTVYSAIVDPENHLYLT